MFFLPYANGFILLTTSHCPYCQPWWTQSFASWISWPGPVAMATLSIFFHQYSFSIVPWVSNSQSTVFRSRRLARVPFQVLLLLLRFSWIFICFLTCKRSVILLSGPPSSSVFMAGLGRAMLSSKKQITTPEKFSLGGTCQQILPPTWSTYTWGSARPTSLEQGTSLSPY